MKGLLLRLSALDADAESAVRVIAFFDQLVADRRSLDALLHATAALAECPVGLDAPRRGVAARAQPTAVLPPAGRTVRQVRPLSGGATVWLERSGDPFPLDEIVLERFAIAAALLLDPAHPALPELGDSALVELVLGESAGDAERARALHLLGIAPTAVAEVAALAASPGDPVAAARSLAEVAGATRLYGAQIGAGYAAVLLGATVPADFVPPPGIRMGIGTRTTAGEAPRAWHTARIALRFTAIEDHPSSAGHPPGRDILAGSQLLRYAQLGALALLAEHVPSDAIGRDPDVAAIDALAHERGGQETLATLHALVGPWERGFSGEAVQAKPCSSPGRRPLGEGSSGGVVWRGRLERLPSA